MAAPGSQPAEASDEQWFYLTQAGEQRGPLSGGALLRMAERGVVQMECLVWRPGAEAWGPLYDAPALKARVQLVRSQFYVADANTAGGRLGPFNLGDLRRRFEDGDIDGMTSVWWSAAADASWVAVAEVPELRGLLVSASDEGGESVGGEDMVFEQNVQPEMPKALHKDKNKTFVGDDGKHYGWDGDEWVEVDAADVDEDDEAAGDDAAPAPAVAVADAAADKKRDEKKKKRDKQKEKKKGWDKNASKCWIYIEGVPSDVTLDELKDHFCKVGVLAMDPETQEPKIKIYRDDDGMPKGDASICYANAGSIDLALQILDGGSLRYDTPLKVTRAEFSSRLGAFDESKRRKVNMTKVRLAKKAAEQGLQWANDEDSGATTASALRIIIVKHAFAPEDLDDDADDAKAELLRRQLTEALDAHEPPEKLTIFAKHAQGAVAIKFKAPGEATAAIKKYDGLSFHARILRAHFWDGATDYTLASKAAAEEEDADRIDQFGDWLDATGSTARSSAKLRLRVEQ
mmetsp:Transcript_7807/g.27704  ORF Transcript_7807/g.27704 Transcript_7807/m.27704 type:complete len:516 (+) Transcript_7807:86-1633(+)